MKKTLCIIAVLSGTFTFAQNYSYDAVKELSITELSSMVDGDERLSKDEKKGMKSCLTKKDFTFDKNPFYACIKENIAREKHRQLLQPVKNNPNENSTDVAIPPGNGTTYNKPKTERAPEGIRPE